MALVVSMQFSGALDLRPGHMARISAKDDCLCTLAIERLENLKHGKDLYKHTVQFTAPDWRDGSTVSAAFSHKYSHGLLSLVAVAAEALLKKYPELKAGRFGVPRNRVKCLGCGTLLWSQFRHDFTRCRCGKVTTDGGYDYIHRGGEPELMLAVRESWQPSDSSQAKKSSAASAAASSPRKRKVTAPTPTPAIPRSTKKAKSTPRKRCSSANAVSKNGMSGTRPKTKYFRGPPPCTIP